jgi:hypothetical protein
MSWKNIQQNSFADSLVIEHKSLSELDDVIFVVLTDCSHHPLYLYQIYPNNLHLKNG